MDENTFFERENQQKSVKLTTLTWQCIKNDFAFHFETSD